MGSSAAFVLRSPTEIHLSPDLNFWESSESMSDLCPFKMAGMQWLVELQMATLYRVAHLVEDSLLLTLQLELRLITG